MTAAEETRAYLAPATKPASFGRALVEQLLAEHDAAMARAESEAIGEEWGVRVTYTNGTTFEGACAATEAEARCILAELDSDLNRPDVASRVLLVRTITKNGQWRDAEPEGAGDA